ncbi:hypothetical protein LIER_06890 [Lithospermum erythrorhizon]|uniref:non-specific serine/threonine protein kinase n=1 Tax=Lithospermum erythrorhizon TaxID=34254 RepID=A0AAV3P7K3_LITER
MASSLLSLLLLVQVPSLLVYGLKQYESSCNTYRIISSDYSDEKLFYVNEVSVDNDLFCEVLKFDNLKHCLVEGYDGHRYCEMLTPLDKFPGKNGRKLLQKGLSEGNNKPDLDQADEIRQHKSPNSGLLSSRNVAVAAPIMFFVCCILLCPCFYARKKETPHTVLVIEPSSMESVSSMEMNSLTEKTPGTPTRVPPSPLRVPPSPSRFSNSPKLDRNGSVDLNMSQVLRATNSFSPSLVIGEGGFGIVYKAKLPDGHVVAIKRAKKEHFNAIRTEFRSEVDLLAKIEHRNLVKLLGYIDKGQERLIITEYVSNGTLREHLDGLMGKILDFKQRLAIAIDVTHGLTYLHMYSEKQIIHRDVKSSNILLTESMSAKVADFGFARLGDMDSDKTHVSTKVKGTVGYLDPEYMRTYQLTPKSDVYSFGILLLEILTGRRPVEVKKPAEEKVTVRWVFRKYNEGSVRELIDPLMVEDVSRKILLKIFGLAIECAAPTRNDRPDMKTVGEQLWAIRMEYLQSGNESK